MRWLWRAREAAGALFAGRRLDDETTEEMRFHIEMEADRLVRETGLAPAEARRQAALSFGGADRHAAAVRDARGLAWLSGLSLDLRLGARMLVKYPGLTLAGGLSLALAVALAASWFEFLNDMASPKLPVRELDRVVAVESWDRAGAVQERRALHDFVQWRDEVRTITQLSAYGTDDVNVTADDGRFMSLRAARVTASTFGVLGVQPLIGRSFEVADEVDGAALPVLIGHDVWQDLFAGDRSVVGRTLVVGDEPGTVAGVMPAGFGFPMNQQLWLPLRARAAELAPRTGPGISIFGRLAAGTSLAEAQAEFATIGERMAATYPATHEQLRPRVRPLMDAVSMGGVVRLVNLPFILFLLVVCVNVATLVFARTATRGSELAVRSALGASRRRLVLQLMAEAFVLVAAAAALGLAAAQWGLRHGLALFWEVQGMAAPYFFDDTLSSATILYVLALTVLAAAVIGGIPALKATGRSLRPQLGAAGGGGGLRFGGVSTTVIVVQVALCVAFLPVAFNAARDLVPERQTAASFPADRYLTGRMTFQSDSALRPDVGTLFGAAKQRLLAEPGIAGAALVSRMPGFNHPVAGMELESDPSRAYTVRVVAVDADFFDVVNARVVAGRNFHPGDFESDAQPILVDAGWVASQLGGRNPAGERVRFTRGRDIAIGEWHEIVGVVEGMPAAVGPGSPVAFYQPLRTGAQPSVQLYLRTTAAPESLVRPVHEAVASVDPRLAAAELKPLADVWRPVQRADIVFFAGLNVVSFIILLFALIGIYALLSFTVARRAREIAIRAALGANPRGIIVAIFSRALSQIGAGVAIGAAIVSLATVRTPGSAALVAVVAGLMMLFGMAGCVLPAVRALRIQPTDALKAE